MFNVKLNVQQGLHPGKSDSPNAIIPPTGATSLSQSAGAVWGDRHCPLRLLASCFIFHVKLKEFSRVKKFSLLSLQKKIR
jgi:hypothetical protein